MSEPIIIVDYWAKPIPNRRFDFCAMYECDDGDSGRMGWGATEAEAIADLRENWPLDEDVGA